MSKSAGQALFWKPDGLSGVELLRTRGSRHAYAPHAHEGFAFGVVEAGDYGFADRGSRWIAVPGVSVVTVNPEDVHDGRPLGDGGYDYRMLYIETAVVTDALAERHGGDRRCTPLFPDAMVQDRDLAMCLLKLHHALESGSGAGRLERETRLFDTLLCLVSRHARMRRPAEAKAGGGSRIGRRARDYLEAHSDQDVSLGALADSVNMSRFHLLRVFRREYGLPPHAWLMQHRLSRARRALRAGGLPATVAAELGFTDQSHLTRRFVAAFGITPGQYRDATAAR